ncbi:TetR-family transcriptional regulator [Streptomyces sp. L-9-10]|uniref:TetR/AcrR family transcriptional regulator n=1 Tax=unclassified Streptomyces TaxID=2593676 RepID=UPI0010DF0D9C|nr:TetR family transcriptional regulator [Streptomyces sp. L-9-10]RYJ28361.1 TetR-family transcriptional regulator [Streptomyces sp. L-9-10]
MRTNVPETAGLRERKKLLTRRALMEAATDLFERKGFHATSLEDIAAVVNVSPRTLTRYFGSKEGVILGYEDDDNATLLRELAARPAAESPLKAMRAATLAVLDGSSGEDGERYLRVQRLILANPPLLAKSLERTTEHSYVLAGVLAGRMGVDPDADMYPRLVVGVIGAAVQTAKERWLRVPGKPAEQLPDLVREALDLLEP